MFFRRQRRPPRDSPGLSRQKALRCVPVKNPEVREQVAENGEICLTYLVRIKPWFAGIFKKITGRSDTVVERRLQLDLLGATVWEMIDGRRSVADIADAFRAEHQVMRQESELSITSFLRDLGRRGLVVMRAGKD